MVNGSSAGAATLLLPRVPKGDGGKAPFARGGILPAAWGAMRLGHDPASGVTKVSFTVAADDLEETLRVATEAARVLGASGITHDAEVAKISVVGLGMRYHTGVAAAMFEALAAVGINIQMISTSEV